MTAQNSTSSLATSCVIVGGGPAGMTVGFLLARSGVETIVLEKHADFLRDFRGDTVHPSTLRVMDELGLLDEFLKRPHQKLQKFDGYFGSTRLRIADMSRLNFRCPYVAFMPQWDFLNFMAEKGSALPKLKIMMEAEAIGLIQEHGRVTGVQVKTPDGLIDITSDLVIGADGRHSMTRSAANLEVEDIGAPIDVLWFRVPRASAAFKEVFAHLQQGRMLVTIDRGDYWQCAYVIPKNGMQRVKEKGLEAFRRDVAATAPELNLPMNEVKSWDDVKLLTVTIDRLRRWTRPGLLCIGDAAHAMSPVGGVGINLTVQDAVAAANILVPKLAKGVVSEADLDLVRQRRLWPVRFIQGMQVAVQNRVLNPNIGDENRPLHIPLFLKIINALPWLQGITAHILGFGVRSEHVRTPYQP